MTLIQQIQHSKSLSQESLGCQEEDCTMHNTQCADLFSRTFINNLLYIINFECSLHIVRHVHHKIIKIINYLL